MADFEVRMRRLEIMGHPDADRLEIARVGGYRAVVPRGMYLTGDIAAYIPEMSIVPNDILREMGLVDEESGKGRLAGPDGNRVRAKRLRGVLSQGLVYSGRLLDADTCNREEGEDVAGLLGITKWEPPIPPEMAGALERYDLGDKLVSYDVEDVKKHPERLQEGEFCTMHEKIHGSLCYFVVGPDNDTVRISSKGRAASQLVFASEGVDNIYTRMGEKYGYDLVEIADWFADHEDTDDGGAIRTQTAHIFCEVYGKKVQDLHYGTDLDMAVFDVMVNGKYASQAQIYECLKGCSLRPVPLAYEGPYYESIMMEHTSGRSLVPGAGHMREGVVVRPVPEREDMDGRVVLKSVSPEYLTRKGGTEYN